MRIRIKFSKNGSLKYIGHLDVMRFFQKVIRRAEIDIAYSEGFSPHMQMSFAQPLGIGVTSDGEYFDMDMKSRSTSAELVRLMNEQMSDEIQVSNAVEIPSDKANKCMSLVNAADYVVSFKNADDVFYSVKDRLKAFLEQKEILALKKTKRNEEITDIRPFIYEYEVNDNNVFFKISTGSVNNIKPQLIMNTFFEKNGIDPDKVSLLIHRKEIYAETSAGFVPLYKLGEEIV
ncbi:MAG: TIGR03936 family radical SAM-associated protein [Candidatus Alectryocaccobium sp.]|jgi:radical SAM-linked protein|nr:TIGR03936 family radical SAM-associated protein [Lachnospiraceae bacterium]MDY6221210.1 TIGR03936 family radical SAM-associated protein [Candidatus Alectryocaccobium sp.]